MEQRCLLPQLRQSSFFQGGKGDAEAPPAALRSGSAGGGGASSRSHENGSRPAFHPRLLKLHLHSTVLFCCTLFSAVGFLILCVDLQEFHTRTGGCCADVGAHHCLPRGTGKRQGTSSPHLAEEGLEETCREAFGIDLVMAFAHTGNEVESATPGIRAV